MGPKQSCNYKSSVWEKSKGGKEKKSLGGSKVGELILP
jgi:hypothetical protein